MNKISTENEMRVFQARMMEGMYSSLDEFVERINSHKAPEIKPLEISRDSFGFFKMGF